MVSSRHQILCFCDFNYEWHQIPSTSTRADTDSASVITLRLGAMRPLMWIWSLALLLAQLVGSFYVARSVGNVEGRPDRPALNMDPMF